MLMSEEDGSCRQCPFGTYQDNINSVTCKTCPLETSTDSVGSANASQCKGTFKLLTVCIMLIMFINRLNNAYFDLDIFCVACEARKTHRNHDSTQISQASLNTSQV